MGSNASDMLEETERNMAILKEGELGSDEEDSEGIIDLTLGGVN